MSFRLLAVGTRMPEWVATGFNEYNKRLPTEYTLQLQEIPLARRSKASSIRQAVGKESQLMMEQLRNRDYVVALDIAGRQLDTRQLAERLEFLLAQARDVTLLIGGPDGMDGSCLERADERWSLSQLTLPHPLVRVVLAEQFYRAWSLSNNHPYHRA